MIDVIPEALTSYPHVTKVMGISSAFSTGDVDAINFTINDASEAIIQHLMRDEGEGYGLKYQTITDEKHDGNGKDLLFLNHWPIISTAAQITLYDDLNRDYTSSTLLSATNDEYEVFRPNSGIIRRVDAIFTKGQQNLKTDYVGGFSKFSVTPKNNVFDVDLGSGAVVITLTTGLYNASTLATEIDTQLTAAGGTYTVTYDETLHLMTLTKSSGTFSILWNNSANEAKANNFADLIGFDSDSDSKGALTYTSANPLLGIPSDLEYACLQLVLWNFMRDKERWTAKISESREDQAISFDFDRIPRHIQSRLARYKRRRVG